MKHIKDHPRVGGEKLTTFDAGKLIPGSPPRGRGKVTLAHVASLALGITPAWAGKRNWKQRLLIFRRDHPRVGGEKKERRKPAFCGLGSPPRGRGKAQGACR